MYHNGSELPAAEKLLQIYEDSTEGADQSLKNRRDNYFAIAKINQEQLTQLFGSDFYDRLLAGNLTEDELIEASKTYERLTFQTPLVPEGVLPTLLDNGDSEQIETLGNMNNTTYFTGDKIHIAEELLKSGLGMILVRPEIYHLLPEVIAFMESNGYKIVYNKQKEVNFSQYWALYDKRLADPDLIRPVHIRSRAQLYIGKPLQLIAFYHPESTDAQHSADMFRARHKGVGGRIDQTLRGSLIYQEMLNMKHTYSRLEALALDPLGIIRRLLQENHGYEIGVRDPFLACFPGIHSADKKELVKDISVLCSEDELDEILINLIAAQST